MPTLVTFSLAVRLPVRRSRRDPFLAVRLRGVRPHFSLLQGRIRRPPREDVLPTRRRLGDHRLARSVQPIQAAVAPPPEPASEIARTARLQRRLLIRNATKEVVDHPR